MNNGEIGLCDSSLVAVILEGHNCNLCVYSRGIRGLRIMLPEGLNKL